MTRVPSMVACHNYISYLTMNYAIKMTGADGYIFQGGGTQICRFLETLFHLDVQECGPLYAFFFCCKNSSSEI